MLRLFRNAARLALGKSGMTMRRHFHGQKVYFDPGTDIGWQLFVGGRFEHQEIEVCRAFLDPRSVVIDIGANIGLHTIAFSKIASEGLVVSVEASPQTFRWLLRNTEGLSNVVTLDVAMGSRNGVAEFFVAADNAYSGLRDTGRRALLRVMRVPCYTADHVLLPLLPRKADMVKIDVEGLETEVIAGMPTLLAESRPIVFCEIYGGKSSNPDPELTIRSLRERQYRPYTFDGQTLRAFTRHDDSAYNYFFVPEEKVDKYLILNGR
jgi:FkbM family methyltransferase